MCSFFWYCTSPLHLTFGTYLYRHGWFDVDRLLASRSGPGLIPQSLDIRGIDFKLYAVILLLIALVYRFLLYMVLVFKKR